MRHSLGVVVTRHCAICILAPTFACASMQMAGRIGIFGKTGLGRTLACVVVGKLGADQQAAPLTPIDTVSPGFNSLVSCDEDGNQM